MSDYIPKDMSGTLFKNDQKTEDRHPNAKGSCVIDGVEYWISSWTKEGKRGKFQSLSFKRKDQPKIADKSEAWKARAPAPKPPPLHDMEEDIPF